MEILIVLFIAGLIINFASINIGNSSKKKFHSATKNLYLQMRLAAEEAVLLNTEYGLDIQKLEDNQIWRYSWLRYDAFGETWHRAQTSGLKGGELPADTEIEVENTNIEIDARSLTEDDNNAFQANRETEDETAILRPEIMFLSSGEVTPFNISLQNTDNQETAEQNIVLSSGASGKLKMRTEN